MSSLIERYRAGECESVWRTLFESGDAVALIDDLVTRLNSKLIGREQMLAEARRRDITINCNTIVVLVDREQGAQQSAEQYGLSLHC